jgi:hypothetical protein
MTDLEMVERIKELEAEVARLRRREPRVFEVGDKVWIRGTVIRPLDAEGYYGIRVDHSASDGCLFFKPAALLTPDEAREQLAQGGNV